MKSPEMHKRSVDKLARIGEALRIAPSEVIAHLGKLRQDGRDLVWIGAYLADAGEPTSQGYLSTKLRDFAPATDGETAA